CGQEGRRGRRRGIVRGATAPLHARPPGLDPTPRGHWRRYRCRDKRPPEGNPRPGAGPDEPAARLLLRAALRVCRRTLPFFLSALRAEAPGPLDRKSTRLNPVT